MRAEEEFAMPRYKPAVRSPTFPPMVLDEHIHPGPFASAPGDQVDEECDLAGLETRFQERSVWVRGRGAT